MRVTEVTPSIWREGGREEGRREGGGKGGKERTITNVRGLECRGSKLTVAWPMSMLPSILSKV